MYPQLDYARLDYERQHQESIRRFVQREEQLCDLRPVRFGLRARAQLAASNFLIAFGRRIRPRECQVFWYSTKKNTIGYT
jgi:hypothetical protein